MSDYRARKITLNLEQDERPAAERMAETKAGLVKWAVVIAQLVAIVGACLGLQLVDGIGCQTKDQAMELTRLVVVGGVAFVLGRLKPM